MSVISPVGAEVKRERWYQLSPGDVAGRLDVDPAQGLSGSEVERRRQAHGANVLAAKQVESGLQAFLRQYQDLMQIILVGAAVVNQIVTGEVGTTIVLVGLTIFNAVLGLRQEAKAQASLAALQKMLKDIARVRRDGVPVEIDAAELVPGDIVLFEAGNRVPADGRLLLAATLEIEEAALTGESAPVLKDVAPIPGDDVGLGDRICLAFMNTSVTRGRGEMIVTGTGMDTEIGSIAKLLNQTEADKTPLQKQLDGLTRVIVGIAGLAFVAMLILGIADDQPFDDLFLAGVCLAISAIPTGLPAVVTTLYSAGTRVLAQHNAIVKRLPSVETLGSVSAICSDKTGTLTLNKMTAREMVVPGRNRFTISGEGYATTGEITHDGGLTIDLDDALLPMALSADARLDESGELIGDPTEGALIVLAAKGGIDVDGARQRHPRVAEVPFDSDYKFMATFHRMVDRDGREVVRGFMKGAPDVLLDRASSYWSPGDAIDGISADQRAAAVAENQRMGQSGQRVMVVARRDFDVDSFDASADLISQMHDLTIIAMVGIVDPPRAEAKAAIAKCHNAGIEVRMITGDHAVTAAAIGKELGITGRALTGAEFAALTDEELAAQLPEIGVVARVAPEDKIRLVHSLQLQSNIVAMTGDGVNDAPALKKADIGVAMGITGTEVSKDAAVMILTDDNFATIVRAVEYGRELYDNLSKYIRFQMAALVGFIATFLGAAIFSIADGIPFSPLAVLWINFVVQVPIAIALGFDKPLPGLMAREPRPLAQPVLDMPQWVRAVLLGLLTAAATLWAREAFEEWAGALVATTMAVTVFSLMNVAMGMSARSRTRTIFTRDIVSDRRQLALYGGTIVAIVLATELDVLNRVLDTTSLTGGQWLACVLLAVALILVEEITKLVLRRQEPAVLEHLMPPPDDKSDQYHRILSELRVAPGARADLESRPTVWAGVGEYESLKKKKLDAAAKDVLKQGIKRLSDAQELLWASDTRSLLVVFQAMDAAGKDSTIEHVMSGVNPQGVSVVSFKTPSSEDLDHTYLWRLQKHAPERGRIGIFNRSHYEEVVALRVHPDWLDKQRLPHADRGSEFWAERYDDLNAWERHLDRNGTKVVKLFLHVSKAEQKKRFLARLDNPEKQWKFNAADVAERDLWDDYMAAYEDALSATSTEWAPWYVVPADNKRVMQALTVSILVDTIEALDLQFPTVSDKDRKLNAKARRALDAEPS